MNIIQLAIPVFFFLIFVELSWAFIQKKNVYSLADAFANIGCGITEQLSGLLVGVITVGSYSWIYQNWAIVSIPSSSFFLFLLFLSVDFSYYWAHRMSHEINLFWVGHSIHHQSERYNLSVALRQGALQKLFTLPFFLWMAFLGFNDHWFLFIYALNTLYQFWIHTESIRTLPKWFEFIFNTPSHHRVHHGRNAQYIDKNHGGSLIIWDRLFGTFEAEKEKVIYGVTSQTSTWNPIHAHWIPIQNLWMLMKNTPIPHWYKILFYSPTWLHNHRFTLNNAVAIKAEYETFIPKPLLFYALSHFALLIGAISFFLFFHLPESKFLPMTGIVVLFLIEIGLLSRLFENRQQKIPIEFVRIILIGVLMILFFGLQYLGTILLLLIFQFFFLWIPNKHKVQSFTVHPTNEL